MFRKLISLSLLLVLVVIVLGAYVRLSDAGLGCPDWPGCFGSPVISETPDFIKQAREAFPDVFFDKGKAWKEMIHRYVAGALGILILLMNLIAWRQKPHRLMAMSCSFGLLLLVGFQAALGMWTVTMKVMPIVVTSHLLLGMMTCWLLYRFFLQTGPDIERREHIQGPRRLAQFAMLVLFLQIILGGWTSTNYAALACEGFPQCNNSWWPVGDYKEAGNLVQGLITGNTEPLSAEGKIAAHWMHRVGALVTFIVLTMVMFIASSGRYPRLVRKSAVWLSALLLLQICLGVANVRMNLPMWSAISHNGVAALLMLLLIRLSFYCKYGLTGESEGVVAKGGVVELETATDSVVVRDVYLEPDSTTRDLRLKSQLKRTRSGLGGLLASLALGQKKIDDDLLEEIETHLIMADVGMEVTTSIMAQLTTVIAADGQVDGVDLLKQQLLAILEPYSQPLIIPKQTGPFVILVVGINGAGKTTTIGKMAKRLQAQGHSVMLAAGDTFRAAAVEQLQAWGERNEIPVIAQQTGADSASVIYDGLQSAKAKGVDVLIADTAGRLHTKANLMEELIKVKRIMGKLDASAPHEVMLVLDAGTGQNAVVQAKQFNEAMTVTGITLTKLDGTAKGGVVFALAKQLGIPIRFIGIGEGIDDLQAFNAKDFIDALFVTD
ncbi:MAG TPA: signal recognition particle-docking protein FtsY [Methylococcaceae bacterium]|jgi:fused signal recognition particle receptor|nr:signal recognition particle-docking protein FtsY [Methylococcaceae bacterium]HIN69419.1 signal recognition particle-docking protein FtsY [Methylococcales bacterium]HIA46256.1 signal recognition particle-docking protein FtsY [Methylococcaceae bacterium]HIB62748.1 signal recognition particle-docking protein FtsY [Methylococcaceae bacterium]HIO12350.1 signal recognition particle-docking protein FtsY [Methylococcales bacterium]